MTATEAATEMNRLALVMRAADIAHNEQGTAATRAALDEAISDYRAAGDRWAVAYALDISAARLAQIWAAA